MGLVKEFCGIVIILTLVRCSLSHPGGASVNSCVNLTPSHGGALPQATESPYTLRTLAGIPINGISIHAGDTFRFALETDGAVPFRGFIIQARTVQNAAIGSFAAATGVQVMTCLPAASTVTHTNNADKLRVEFDWTAPVGVTTNIVFTFHFSVVQLHQIFWTNMQTGFVVILPDGQTPPEGETTIEGDETTTPPGEILPNPYPGCGTTKVCFGTPSGCLITEDCIIFSAVIFEDDKFIFELLSGNIVEYVAVALSADDRMGSSSAMECVSGIGGIVTAFASFTVSNINAPRNVDQSIIRLKYYQNINGRIYCQMERDTLTEVGGMTFDLLNQPHHLLIASGPSLGVDMVGPHDFEGVSSLVNLTIPGIIDDETEEPPTLTNPYPGCGTTKVCFGTPTGCLITEDCNIFSAVIFEDGEFIFELLSGNVVEYVAVALSADDRMGSSSAMECVGGAGGQVTAFASFTVGTTAAIREVVDQSIVRLKYYQNINGRIYCQIERNTSTVVGGLTFDLLNQKHHLLIASGPSVTENMVGPHEADRDVSPLVNLTIPANIEAERRVLVLVHGSLMIVAWIFLSSVGVFIARYFKETWKNRTICGNAVWFFWHFMCMLLTWILTISSFVIIFVEVGEWRTSVHAVTGTVVTALVFFQPIGAIFRPNPTHRNRPLFNFLHFLFGNIIHALAIITIFYAVPMPGSDLPSWTSFILVAFVVFYLLIHAIMTTVRICGDIKSKNLKLGPSKDASNPLLNKTLLGFFLLTVFLFAVALLLILSLPI